MARIHLNRKKRFKSALALAGMTQNEFLKIEGVTRQHLTIVLSAGRESKRLTAKVDAFILKIEKAVSRAA